MLLEVIRGSDAFKNVTTIFEYKYIKIWRFTLSLIGGWPGRRLGERQYFRMQPYMGHMLLCIKITGAYLGCLYLRSHSASLPFLELGHNYITVFMTFVTISRLSTLAVNPNFHKMMVKFLTEIHLFYYKDESEFAMETHIKVHKMSSFFTVYLNFLLLLGTILFNLLPLHVNWKHGKFDKENPNNISFQYSIYYQLPFDFEQNFNVYLVLSAFNWYACYICSNVFSIFDLSLFILVFHVRGHYKILLHRLNNFPIPASAIEAEKNRSYESVQLYSETEMIEIEKTLKSCIDYHRKLLGFTNEISSVFGPMLFVYFTFHQISDCLLLLEISQLTTAAYIRYGPLTLALFQQLIQLSFIIESIGTVTGKLKDAVYSVPWEYMDTKNRKYVAIFMRNVEEPVHVNALGLTKVGVTSMASILKTSFSYFAFLRSVSD